jgi:N-acetylated-alpha-linked acidic dipeptidase
MLQQTNSRLQASRSLSSLALATLCFLLLAGLSLPLAGQNAGSVPPSRVPLGFSPQTYQAEQPWEKRFLSLPSAANCDRFARRLTVYPHVAGTPGDRTVTDFIYREFQRDGLNPEIVEYQVLLSYPRRIRAEIVAPDQVKLANPEPPIHGDKATYIKVPMATMPWNAYSPSADLTLPVVYVNYGNSEDYDQLAKMGVSVKGKIVLARYFHGYRGGKSLEATQRGAAGIIVYSDPADDGAPKGPVYPAGPWGPLGHFQRGSDVFDFQVPGDPETPGWASTADVRRLPEAQSSILPKIPMLPMSAADAVDIVKRLEGFLAPKAWQGGLGVPYHVGGDKVKVHLALEMENRVTPIWDVIARIPGRDESEKTVILSNHHDAWVYGAVDPVSGTASMLETARAFGRLLKEGYRPRRTLVLASWDAEEYTLTGSTEWGEEHAEELRRNGVVCLNVDSSTSGQDFSVSTVPSLLPALIEATQDVRDPATGKTIYDRWMSAKTGENIRSYKVAGAAGPGPFGLLGGGSDYMVFLQHDGVPSLDMLFDGPYGVYHSVYDDYEWMARYGDPGFRYHAAMSRLWGLLALRFADADVPPLDYSLYAAEVDAYLRSLEKMAPPDFNVSDLQPLMEKCRTWREVAIRTLEDLESLRRGGQANVGSQPLSVALMAEERALLVHDGIPGRPWFRHLIYAPLPSYEAETLPGLREALAAGDQAAAREQVKALGKAIDRARQELSRIEQPAK